MERRARFSHAPVVSSATTSPSVTMGERPHAHFCSEQFHRHIPNAKRATDVPSLWRDLDWHRQLPNIR
jgi:hypothetical protein